MCLRTQTESDPSFEKGCLVPFDLSSARRGYRKASRCFVLTVFGLWSESAYVLVLFAPDPSSVTLGS